MTDCTTAVARTNAGPILAETYGDIQIADTELTCYGCEERLYFRRAHTRVVCGISGPVRACFCHFAPEGDTGTRTCGGGGGGGGGEGHKHKAAKHKLLTTPTMQFKTACAVCQTQVDVVVNPEPESSAMHEEHSWSKFKLDVAFVKKDTDQVVGCVEVFATHRVGTEKAAALTQANIAWCEVVADDVLNYTPGEPIAVIGCGLPLYTCAACRDQKERDAAIASRLARQNVLRHFHQTTNDWMKLQLSIKERMDLEKQAIATKLVNLLKDAKLTFLKEVKADASADEAAFPFPKRVKAEVSDTAVMGVVQGVFEPHNVVPFGKYAGRILSDVLEDDFGYVVWLAGFNRERDPFSNRPTAASTQHSSPALRAKARSLIQGHCYNCGESVEPTWKTWCRSCYRV
jgi:hypothetical protein